MIYRRRSVHTRPLSSRYEDCCTIFVAKHPVTKPNLNIIQRDEHNLDDCIDELFKTAIETTEKIRIE